MKITLVYTFSDIGGDASHGSHNVVVQLLYRYLHIFASICIFILCMRLQFYVSAENGDYQSMATIILSLDFMDSDTSLS